MVSKFLLISQNANQQIISIFIIFFSITLQVASESIKIYNAISDGSINLVDKVENNLNGIVLAILDVSFREY